MNVVLLFVILFLRAQHVITFSSSSQVGYIHSIRFDGQNDFNISVPIDLLYDVESYSHEYNPTIFPEVPEYSVVPEVDNGINIQNIQLNFTLKVEMKRKFKKLIGEDDRTVVQNTENFPWSAVGKLVVGECAGGVSHSCTGVLISPYIVLTAAHCVRREKQWCGSIWFTAGYTFGNAQLKLDGSVPVQMNTLQCWDEGNLDCDIALLSMDWPVGCAAGYLGYGYQCARSSIYSINTAGFPQDAGQPSDKMYQSQCEVDIGACQETQRISHGCDTGIGMSGSPLYQMHDTQYGQEHIIRAINRAAKVYSLENVAIKISVQIFQWIQSVVGEFEPCENNR